MNSYVRLISRGKVAEIEFFNPAGNSLPLAMLEELTTKFEDLHQYAEVSVVVLRSGGEKAFCGGASFDELLQINNLEDGKRFFSGFARVINAMRKAPQIIIGRIHGKAVGGGVGLACACDYTLGTIQSSIKLSELAVGIGPFVVGPVIERKAGKSAFAELALLPNDWKPAEWAYSKGIFQHLAASISELDQKTNELAGQLAQYNPEALAELKKIFWQNTDHWDTLLLQRAEISGKLVLSEFTKSFILKFKNKQ